MTPGSSCFPSRGPAEVRRVTERQLVSLSMLCSPPHSNWLAGVGALAGCFLLGQEPEGPEDAELQIMGPGPHSFRTHTTDYFAYTNSQTFPDSSEVATG